MENHYFKTAEFAALCGVRKDTLLHYDHIGLLKPQWVGENGYRYYAAQQLRTYDLIAALRRLGTPLAEIRDYLTRRSPQALLALLEEKEAQLAEERPAPNRHGHHPAGPAGAARGDPPGGTAPGPLRRGGGAGLHRREV